MNPKTIMVSAYIRPDQKEALEGLAERELQRGIQLYIRAAIDLFLAHHPLYRAMRYNDSATCIADEAA